MAEDLKSIDASQLDALAKLEADQRAIRTLAEKAAWRRDKEVDVCTRVLLDYEARMTALVEQAGAVRQRMRDDLQKLNGLHDHHQDALDQARVLLHECEFRHEIGELTDEEFQRRQQAAERTIREREEEFEHVKKLRLRYLELLGETVAEPAPVRTPSAPAVRTPSASAVRTPSAPAVRTPLPPAVPRSAAAAQPIVTEAVAPPASTSASPPDAVKKPPSQPEDATMFLPPPSPGDFRAPPRGKGAANKEPSATISLNPAMLIHDRDGVPGARHRLALSTTIGRAPETQIRVADKEVSRRHAEIVLTEDGYVVKDLGSPNGTFVNGERITEHRLKDGDRITLGGQVFTFKAP